MGGGGGRERERSGCVPMCSRPDYMTLVDRSAAVKPLGPAAVALASPLGTHITPNRLHRVERACTMLDTGPGKKETGCRLPTVQTRLPTSRGWMIRSLHVACTSRGGLACTPLIYPTALYQTVSTSQMGSPKQIPAREIQRRGGGEAE